MSEANGGDRERLEADRMQEIKAHFSQPAYRRLFEEAHRRWKSYGYVGGQQIRLEEATEEECRRIGGLVGLSFSKGCPLVVKMSVLEQSLLKSKWTAGLETLLPLVTGRPLITNMQSRRNRLSAWEAFCVELEAVCERPESAQWLSAVRDGKSTGALTVKKRFEEQAEEARILARLCLRALDELPCWRGNAERLPVFANRLCGDPHAFDWDTQAGRLLYQALCDVFGLEAETTSEWKREVLQEAGLLMDDLASQVIVLGLSTHPEDDWYPFFQLSLRKRVPFPLPLIFLQEKVAWKKAERLYVVENPAVFQSLIDQWPQDRPLPPLVCSSGQPSVAALRLLDAFVAMGTTIWYSGDFDRKGLEMAVALQKRYGESFQAWRMSAGDYASCPLGKVFEEEQLKGMATLDVPWDRELVRVMFSRKQKVFQESLLASLVEDLVAHQQ